MRIIRRRNRRDPKLRQGTIAKVARREAALAKLQARPDSTLNTILIAAKNREIQELIRIDHELFDAGVGSLRAKTFARLMAQPPRVDRRTREGRALKAQAAAPSLPSSSGETALDAIRASIRADAADLALDSVAAVD